MITLLGSSEWAAAAKVAPMSTSESSPQQQRRSWDNIRVALLQRLPDASQAGNGGAACNTGDDDVPSILAHRFVSWTLNALPQLSSLTALSIRECNVTDGMLSQCCGVTTTTIVTAAPLAPRLQVLMLGDNQIESVDVLIAFVRRLADRGEDTVVGIANKPIHDCVEQVTSASSASQLTYIELRGNPALLRSSSSSTTHRAECIRQLPASLLAIDNDVITDGERMLRISFYDPILSPQPPTRSVAALQRTKNGKLPCSITSQRTDLLESAGKQQWPRQHHAHDHHHRRTKTVVVHNKGRRFLPFAAKGHLPQDMVLLRWHLASFPQSIRRAYIHGVSAAACIQRFLRHAVLMGHISSQRQILEEQQQHRVREEAEEAEERACLASQCEDDKERVRLINDIQRAGGKIEEDAQDAVFVVGEQQLSAFHANGAPSETIADGAGKQSHDDGALSEGNAAMTLLPTGFETEADSNNGIMATDNACDVQDGKASLATVAEEEDHAGIVPSMIPPASSTDEPHTIHPTGAIPSRSGSSNSNRSSTPCHDVVDNVHDDVVVVAEDRNTAGADDVVPHDTWTVAVDGVTCSDETHHPTESLPLTESNTAATTTVSSMVQLLQANAAASGGDATNRNRRLSSTSMVATSWTARQIRQGQRIANWLSRCRAAVTSLRARQQAAVLQAAKKEDGGVLAVVVPTVHVDVLLSSILSPLERFSGAVVSQGPTTVSSLRRKDLSRNKDGTETVTSPTTTEDKATTEHLLPAELEVGIRRPFFLGTRTLREANTLILQDTTAVLAPRRSSSPSGGSSRGGVGLEPLTTIVFRNAIHVARCLRRCKYYYNSETSHCVKSQDQLVPIFTLAEAKRLFAVRTLQRWIRQVVEEKKRNQRVASNTTSSADVRGSSAGKHSSQRRRPKSQQPQQHDSSNVVTKLLAVTQLRIPLAVARRVVQWCTRRWCAILARRRVHFVKLIQKATRIHRTDQSGIGGRCVVTAATVLQLVRHDSRFLQAHDKLESGADQGVVPLIPERQIVLNALVRGLGITTSAATSSSSSVTSPTSPRARRSKSTSDATTTYKSAPTTGGGAFGHPNESSLRYDTTSRGTSYDFCDDVDPEDDDEDPTRVIDDIKNAFIRAKLQQGTTSNNNSKNNNRDVTSGSAREDPPPLPPRLSCAMTARIALAAAFGDGVRVISFVHNSPESLSNAVDMGKPESWGTLGDRVSGFIREDEQRMMKSNSNSTSPYYRRRMSRVQHQPHLPPRPRTGSVGSTAARAVAPLLDSSSVHDAADGATLTTTPTSTSVVDGGAGSTTSFAESEGLHAISSSNIASDPSLLVTTTSAEAPPPPAARRRRASSSVFSSSSSATNTAATTDAVDGDTHSPLGTRTNAPPALSWTNQLRSIVSRCRVHPDGYFVLERGNAKVLHAKQLALIAATYRERDGTVLCFDQEHHAVRILAIRRVERWWLRYRHNCRRQTTAEGTSATGQRSMRCTTTKRARSGRRCSGLVDTLTQPPGVASAPGAVHHRQKTSSTGSKSSAQCIFGSLEMKPIPRRPASASTTSASRRIGTQDATTSMSTTSVNGTTQASRTFELCSSAAPLPIERVGTATPSSPSVSPSTTVVVMIPSRPSSARMTRLPPPSASTITSAEGTPKHVPHPPNLTTLSPPPSEVITSPPDETDVEVAVHHSDVPSDKASNIVTLETGQLPQQPTDAPCEQPPTYNALQQPPSSTTCRLRKKEKRSSEQAAVMATPPDDVTTTKTATRMSMLVPEFPPTELDFHILSTLSCEVVRGVLETATTRVASDGQFTSATSIIGTTAAADGQSLVYPTPRQLAHSARRYAQQRHDDKLHYLSLRAEAARAQEVASRNATVRHVQEQRVAARSARQVRHQNLLMSTLSTRSSRVSTHATNGPNTTSPRVVTPKGQIRDKFGATMA